VEYAHNAGAARAVVEAPPQLVVTARDMTSGERVGELFNCALDVLRERPPQVLIDLHGVTAADTKLLACIIALYRLALEMSVQLEVCVSNAVMEITRICRLEPVLGRVAREA